MSQTESHIIKGLIKGDEQSFNHIFHLYQKPLSYLAFKLLGDEEDAKDMVAEVFVKLWNLRRQFNNLPSVRAFLYIALRNLCFDFLSSNKRAEGYKKDYAYWMTHEWEAAELMYTSELIGTVLQEIEALPPRQKEVFRMAYFEGLTSDEIAEKMQLSLQTVWNHKTAALKNIRFRFLQNKLSPVLLIGFLGFFDIF